uniref:NADH:ubiquinone reductase (non-electrogenic) n=1 Tax=Arcella intermedia TaxID=1963864 RepID=A0A6B2L224_9EUKA|eukprot:TRINITY_DN3670_c0_g1_i1.p1 TRINITY_DN3670_c0_g1~~TRINITY_DN3670_c0_g1_i1.p1  ORF type:complete len:597 (+),score=154.37 TRINITY_DN3670_c0_g1_i1:252-1793(+)
MNEPEIENKEKVVILGSGFGALGMLSTLDTKKFDISVVSPRNYFMYTPLLPATTSGLVNFESIVEPVRFFGHRTQKDFKYYEAFCEDVDLETNTIHCKPVQKSNSFSLQYDHLVIAVGGYNETFNIPGVTQHCNFLNSLNDGRRIRNRIIDAIETANLPEVPEEEKKRLMHNVIVGGGPVAREMASLVQDFVQEKLSSLAPESESQLKSYAKVSIIKTDDHIHNHYDYAISKCYEKKLQRKEIEVIANTIQAVGDKEIQLKKGDSTVSVPYSSCLWLTGKTIQPLAAKIASKLEEQENSLALVVDASLKLQGAKNVYAVGDCATISQKTLIKKWEHIFLETDLNKDGVIDKDEFSVLTHSLSKKYPGLKEIIRRKQEFFESADINKDGKLQSEEFVALMQKMDKILTRFPSTASTASQQGAFLGDHFNSGEHLKEETDHVFKYKHIGGYEYIGAEEGLVERGSRGTAIITGTPGATWLWTSAYYSVLVSLPMRIKVSTNKLYSHIFGRDISRL